MSAKEIESLTRRITALEDEREIRYLIGRYGHYVDLGHEDAWVDQWTEDGVYDLVTVKRNGAGYDGNMRFEGKEQLYEMVRDPTAHKLFEGRSLHIQDINLVVHIEGDHATAHGYSITMLRDGDEVAIRTAGMVRWTFRKVAGQWRIEEKHRRKIGDGSGFLDTPFISAHDAAHAK